MDEKEQKKMLCAAFDAASTGYDNSALCFFPRSAGIIPSILSLNGSERVLDVATGTGHAAIALAAALPNGRVTGIDFSEGMLAQAKEKLREKGIGNVELLKMDMQEIEFPDNSFDAAVFAFSVFFVEDMVSLLRHASSKVVSGGRVLATTFGPSSFSPQAEMFLERIKNYGVEVPQKWRKLSTKDECTELFSSAGLKDVKVVEKDLGYCLTNAAQWWDLVWNAGFRKFVAMLPPEKLEKFKTEHLKEISALSGEGGIPLEMKILFTTGVK